MTYEDLKQAYSIIKRTLPFIQDVRNDAKAKHDTYGEFYMDDGVYAIIEETEILLQDMKLFLKNFEKK